MYKIIKHNTFKAKSINQLTTINYNQLNFQHIQDTYTHPISHPFMAGTLCNPFLSL